MEEIKRETIVKIIHETRNQTAKRLNESGFTDNGTFGLQYLDQQAAIEASAALHAHFTALLAEMTKRMEEKDKRLCELEEINIRQAKDIAGLIQLMEEMVAAFDKPPVLPRKSFKERLTEEMQKG